MNDEIKIQLKLLTKTIDKVAQDHQNKNGYNHQTENLRLLAELIREQADAEEIHIKYTPKRG